MSDAICNYTSGQSIHYVRNIFLFIHPTDSLQLPKTPQHICCGWLPNFSTTKFGVEKSEGEFGGEFVGDIRRYTDGPFSRGDRYKYWETATAAAILNDVQRTWAAINYLLTPCRKKDMHADINKCTSVSSRSRRPLHSHVISQLLLKRREKNIPRLV